MDVSATLTAPDGTQEVRLFFVDSDSPGFRVTRQEFMGLRGAQIGVVRLDGVRVPAEYMLAEGGDGWRMRPTQRTVGQQQPDVSPEELPNDRSTPLDLALLALRGRHLVIAPTSLAIAKLCLLWSKEFVNRRRIDDRSLSEYDEIQRQIAETAADVFTIESVAVWPLLGAQRADTEPDLAPIKNLASVTCWRVVDRTVSLLGAEGYETARSKALRGALPIPVERYFRDARSLRVAGGVDFMLDKWSAQSRLLSCHYAGPGMDAGAPPAEDGPAPEDPALSPHCQEHLRFVADQARSFAELCHRITRDTSPEELSERQRMLTVIGQIANELLSMSIVLARAAQLAEQGNPAALELADISCTMSAERLNSLWLRLDTRGPDFAATSDGLLRGTRFDFLADGVIAGIPPIPNERTGSNTHA
jgi:hypothetical protein